MKSLKIIPVFVATLFSVEFVSAAATLKSILGQIAAFINLLVPIVIALAVLGFFWGLMMYIFSGADEDKKKGLNIMMMGILALFVMVSVWGIIAMLQRTFSIDKGRPIIPDVIERNYYYR